MNRAIKLLIIATGAILGAILLGYTPYSESYAASFIVGALWGAFAEFILFPLLGSKK